MVNQASATTADSSTTILARLAARERELEQKKAELAAARAEIVRLKAEIVRLRHHADVAANVEGIADQQVANDTGPVLANDAHYTPKAFASDQVAMDPELHEAVAGTAEPLCGSNVDEKDSEPPKRGRGRPRVHPPGLALSAAQQKALEIAEAKSTVRWDDEVRAVTKKALVELKKLVEFGDDCRPALTETGRLMLDLIRNGGSPRPLV